MGREIGDRSSNNSQGHGIPNIAINSPTSSNHKSLSPPNTTSNSNLHNLHIQRNISLRTNSLTSLPDTQLSAKPHAFSGAVLNPKQARELTPKIVLNITHTLGNYALDNANAYSSHGPSSHSGESNTSYHSGSGNNNHNKTSRSSADSNANAANEAKIQYTVWITEAWRCLGWAEPSAALFWEMATMYHTLHVAARSIEVEETEMPIDGEDGEDHFMGIQRTLSQSIPPILSCGSSASMESEDAKKKEKMAKAASGGSGTEEKSPSPYRNNLESPRSPSSPNRSSSPRKGNNGGSNSSGGEKVKNQSNKASAGSAKELPVWLVGMYLLLHCEEGVFLRNVSGEDAQRFDALMAKQGQGSISPGVGEIFKDGKAVDFGMLLQNSMSMRYV